MPFLAVDPRSAPAKAAALGSISGIPIIENRPTITQVYFLWQERMFVNRTFLEVENEVDVDIQEIRRLLDEEDEL